MALKYGMLVSGRPCHDCSDPISLHHDDGIFNSRSTRTVYQSAGLCDNVLRKSNLRCDGKESGNVISLCKDCAHDRPSFNSRVGQFLVKYRDATARAPQKESPRERMPIRRMCFGGSLNCCALHILLVVAIF